MASQDGTVETGMMKRTVRGKWTAQLRIQIVEVSLVDGASINEVAEQYGIRPNLLTAWRRRYAASVEAPKRKRTQVRFSAVRVNSAPTDGTIEIDLSSRLIRVRGIVGGAMLREVLAETP
jgi:transposase-like protein